jgi:DNA replication protein DnaC
MLSVYDEQLRAAETADVSYSEFIAGLLRAQWHERQESALEWRIGRANLPERWSLESFPYTRQPGVNRKQIRAFAELDFVAKHENLVFVGPTGVGKTGLACGLSLKALQNGHRCQFVRAQDLFEEMYASLADRSTRQLLIRLSRLDVLRIDEFGYLNLKPEQSNTFFKRYHRRSTIITTNLGYDEWQNFLGNKPMVDALLSRVPFEVEDSVAAQIEHLGVVLPEPVVEDFCDAIPLAQLAAGAEAVKAFIDSASASASERGRWREFQNGLEWRGTGIPWRDGYNEARALRSCLGLTGPISPDLNSFLRRELGSFEIRDFAVPSRIDAISAPTQTGAPWFGYRSHLREENKRFILCRALSDHLASGQPSLVTRSGTEHQQRNRAFAAEFLAPAESIKERIGGDRVGEEDIEELARNFSVRPSHSPPNPEP